MGKIDSLIVDASQSFKVSIALQKAIEEVNTTYLKMVDVIIQQRLIDPLGGVLVGLSDEALDEYAKIDKEDKYQVAKMGLPLVAAKLRDPADIRALAATGFSSASLVSLLTMDENLAPSKTRK